MRHAPFGRPRRPLGTFPRGESTSSARRRAKPSTRNRFLMEGKGKSLSCFPRIPKDFASAEATKGLSARPLETFGALLLERIGFFTKTRFLVEGRGKTFLAFPCFAEGFASAEATKGLSGRPLETFGPLLRMGDATRNRLLMEDKGRAFLAFPVSQRISPLRRRPKGFPLALWKPSGPTS